MEQWKAELYGVPPLDSDGVIAHWGLFGMKWGKRRFRNYDCTLTPEGRERYYNKPNGPIKYYTNEELIKFAERNEAEARYKQSLRNNGKDLVTKADQYMQRTKNYAQTISAIENTAAGKMATAAITDTISDFSNYRNAEVAAGVYDTGEQIKQWWNTRNVRMHK